MKVGDKVRIKSLEEILTMPFAVFTGGRIRGLSDVVTPPMLEILGRTVEISAINGYGVSLKGDNVWNWPKEVLGPIEDSIPPEIVSIEPDKDPRKEFSLGEFPVGQVKAVSAPTQAIEPKEYYRHFHNTVMGTGTVYGYFKEDLLYLSISLCSAKDNFCRKTGRDRAKKRMAISPQLVLRYVAELNHNCTPGKFFLYGAELMIAIFANGEELLISINEKDEKK